MTKAGMQHEGRLRHHVIKWGKYQYLEVHSVLHGD